MASILLIYCWLKLFDRHLFTVFVDMRLQTSNFERKGFYIGIHSKYIHSKQNDVNIMKYITNLMQMNIYLSSFSSTCFGLTCPSSGAMDFTISLRM